MTSTEITTNLRKMKILVVSEARWTKGVTYDIHIIAESLSYLGNTVLALDPGTRVEYPNPSGHVKRLNFHSKPVELISPTLLKPIISPRRSTFLRILFENLTNEWIRMQWVKSILHEKQVDIVLLYSAHRLGPMVSRIARKMEIPVVFRCIDQLYNLEKYKSVAFFLKFREYLTYRRTNRFLALTPNYADYLVELGAIREDISVLPFPIDTKMFKPDTFNNHLEDQGRTRIQLLQSLNLPTELNNEFLAVFMGVFYEFGGLSLLLDSLSTKLNSNSRTRIILVGDGPARLALEAKIQVLGLQERVFITGYQPFELMPKYLELADICINVWPINARTEDIFSAKIVQYLSCGKPVLSSALNGIMRALPESLTGVLYFEDIDTLVEKLEILSRDSNLVKNLGVKGRKYIESFHSVEKIASDMEDYLLKMIIRNHD